MNIMKLLKTAVVTIALCIIAVDVFAQGARGQPLQPMTAYPLMKYVR